jgi:NTP pyrophosphatase (non-canonical NTP hydrolase)
MNKRVNEALNLLQEECAEVIVEVSKCNRFGLDNLHYKTGATHKSMLEQEIGDVLALVDILIEEGAVSHVGLIDAKLKKINKLKEWSNLYEQN